MFQSIKLREELLKVANNQKQHSDTLLEEAYQILNTDCNQENAIAARAADGVQKLLPSDSLEQSELFEIAHIKQVCAKYRLRFLDIKLYKGEIPQEALSKLRRLENEHRLQVNNLRVLAPAERFKLADSKADPILLAPTDDGRFYFVHQWGDDLAWHKSIVRYPFRNLKNLSITLMILAGFLTAALPLEDWFVVKSVFFFKFYVSFMVAGMLLTAALIFGIVRSMEFSEDAWDSRYFN